MEFSDKYCSCYNIDFDSEFLSGNSDYGQIKLVKYKSRKTQHFQDHMIKYIQDLKVDESMFADSGLLHPHEINKRHN